MGGGGVHNPSNRLPAGTSPICPSRETVRCTALTLDTRSTVELFHLFLIITCSLSLQMTLLCWSLRSRRVWVVQVFSWSPCRSSSPCPPSYYPSYYIDTELQTQLQQRHCQPNAGHWHREDFYRYFYICNWTELVCVCDWNVDRSRDEDLQEYFVKDVFLRVFVNERGWMLFPFSLHLICMDTWKPH